MTQTRQMVRWNKTGEVMVIDTATGTASAALAQNEQSSALDAYELDYDLAPDADGYTVIAPAATPTAGAILDPAIVEYCEDNNLPLPTQIETANAAWLAADDDLTIQAADMVTLFPGRPELHTATRFRALLVGALR